MAQRRRMGRWQPAEGHEPTRRRVYPPIPDPRVAGRVPPHPLLRLPRQQPPRAEAGAVSGTAPHGAGCTSRSAGRLSRQIRSPDRNVATPMPALPHRHHGGGRLHRPAQGLSADPGHLTMHRTRTTPMTLQGSPRRRWSSAALILTLAAPAASLQPSTPKSRPALALLPRIRPCRMRRFEPRPTRPMGAQADRRHSTPIARLGGAV